MPTTDCSARKRVRIDALTPTYGADFETDCDPDRTRAWIAQWAVSNGTKRFHGPVTEDGSCPEPGTALTDFYGFVMELLDAKPKCCIYFHNLKFDAQFIRAAFHWMEESGCVVTPIVRMGSPVSIEIQQPETGNTMWIRDSMKKMPGSVRNLAKTVGMRKLEPPGGTSFEPGWSQGIDYSEDSMDWDYIDADADIPAVAMQRLHSQGRTHATASGDAWASAKEMINVSDDGTHWVDKWTKYFPRICAELDTTWRRGYAGGLNISRWMGLCSTLGGDETAMLQATLDGIARSISGVYRGDVLTHEDVHSMYATVMMYDPLPIGLPTETHVWPSDRFLWIGELRIKLRLRDDGIPWYRFKATLDNLMEGWPSDALVEVTYAWHDMILTSVDLATLSEWYEIEFDESFTPTFWVFNHRTGLLGDYIRYWFRRKEEAEKGSLSYVSAKLMLNSLYGRFALSPESEDTEMEWDDDLEDWDFASVSALREDNDAYLPFAMFVTAHARARLLANVRAVGPENVIHCDTDSVIHWGGPSRGVMHGDALGTWGIESHPVELYEGGFKRYIEVLHSPIRSLQDVAVACAGVPQPVSDEGVPTGMWVELLDDPEIITRTGYTLGQEHYRIRSEWLRTLYLDNGMDPDDINTMKLIPRKVPGGVILEERRHALTDNMVRRMRIIA